MLSGMQCCGSCDASMPNDTPQQRRLWDKLWYILWWWRRRWWVHFYRVYVLCSAKSHSVYTARTILTTLNVVLSQEWTCANHVFPFFCTQAIQVQQALMANPHSLEGCVTDLEWEWCGSSDASTPNETPQQRRVWDRQSIICSALNGRTTTM